MIFIGLGANLASSNYDTPKDTLLSSLAELEKYNIIVENISSWYESAPVPMSDAPWYVNAVAAVKTDLSAKDLLKTLLTVELSFGRVRSVPNAPRIIDLDLIAYHDLVYVDTESQDEKPFCVPHPRLEERAFVLLPIKDLAPIWVHPKTGASITELVNRLDPTQQIRRMPA